MIFLRTSGTDDNSAGASEFVSVPVPVGVQDGDLVLVAIAVDSADVTITPPDSLWTKAFRTDPSRAVSLALYWKVALNEQDRWVFGLSASSDAQGVCAVYGGADGWEPVEIVTAAATLASASQATPASASSVDSEEAALFLCADDADSFTPATGYLEEQAKQNVGSIAFHHKPLPSAGAIAAGTVTFGTSADGASLLAIIRPSVGTTTVDEVRKLIVDKFPADADRVYDLEPGGDYYKLFQAIALAAKETVFDLIDVLRLEILPRFARYKLPDWERIFGLTTTRAARVGTVPDRQAQVVSRWREAAGLGSTRDAITAILGPLLGYNEGTEVQVVTCDRDLLEIEHSYTKTDGITVADGAISSTFEFSTVDGGYVSSAGIRVTLEYAAFAAGQIECTLIGTDGTTKTWTIDGAGQALDLLFGAEFAGAPSGKWRLWVENNSGASMTFIPTVFVECVQVDHLSPRQETAAAIFDWGIYADPDHLGENGKAADFAAARAALQRLAFSHTDAGLLQSLEPYPDEESGLHAAIPDECIPTA